MRQARPEMIAGSIEENLRLVLQPTKRARMDDARPVALKLSAVSVPGLRKCTPPRIAGFLRERREHAALIRFHLFPFLPNPGPQRRATRIIPHSKDYPRRVWFASLNLAIEVPRAPKEDDVVTDNM